MPGIVKMDCERLQQSAQPFRLVILSPRLRSQKVVAACFIGKGQANFLYTLTPDDTDLRSFLSALGRAFQEMGAGRELQSVLKRQRPSEQALAEALVADVARIDPDLRNLVLDCFDYLVLSDDVRRFFEHLAACLPDGVKIIIDTRQLPHRFWSPFVRAGQAVVLTDGETTNSLSPDQLERPHLEIYALSVGQVYSDGLLIEDWDGPLPRNLFFYLVDHPSATRNEIFEVFWPELSVKEATNVFHVTKRKITERLGCELTEYASGFYHHNDAIRLHYDVAEFEHAAAQAEQASPEQAPALWKQVVACYRVPFLHTNNMPWIDARREQLKGTYASALIQLGRIYRHEGETDLAVSFFLRAQREFPEREDLCRDLMTLYQHQGETSKAADQYHRLANRLRTKLGIKPSKTTEKHYQQITDGRS